MKDEVRTRLTKIIGEYDAKLSESERVANANRAADASFPERFLALRADTIRPALQEIVDLLTAAGHEATVRDQDESSSTVGGVNAAACSLRLVPKPFAHKSAEPSPVAIEVMFSANRAERKLIVSSTNTMVSHGGSVGKRGSYELEAFTRDVAATHVLETLGDAFVSSR